MAILGLFFSSNVSLKKWIDSGLFEREKLIYEKHLENKTFEKIYWFTYGINDTALSKKLKSENLLNKNIFIIDKPKKFYGRIGSLLYSLLLPFFKYKIFKEIDILKTNQILGSWTGVITKFIYKIPLILRSGYTPTFMVKDFNFFNKLIYTIFEWIGYKFCTFAIVASKKDREYVLNRYNLKKTKVIVNYNYVDINLFRPIKMKKYLNRIIFIGRLSNQKNLFNLFKALKNSKFSLDIYGGGELEKDLKLFVKKEKLSVKFKGIIKNDKLPKILNKYNFYVLTSHYEGMPKTLLEAMSCGLVSLGTNVQGINEVIINNENGFLVDVTSSSIKLGLNCLNSEKKSFNKISKNARKTIENNFSLNSVIKLERKLFKSIKI